MLKIKMKIRKCGEPNLRLGKMRNVKKQNWQIVLSLPVGIFELVSYMGDLDEILVSELAMSASQEIQC